MAVCARHGEAGIRDGLLRLLAPALVLLLAGCAAEPLPDDATRLEEARFLRVGAAPPGELPTPPPDDAPGWEPLRLPDRWRERRPDAGGLAWYRLQIPLPTAGAQPALLLPAFNMNAAVYVGGQRVGGAGRLREPVAHRFNHPLLVELPRRRLAEAGGRVDVLLFAYPHHFGALGPVAVGPATSLRPVYERRLLLQHELPRLASAVALLTALFVGALWVATRFDGLYGLFVATCLLWTLPSLNYWLAYPPLPHWTWERVVHASLDGFAIALALWAHRLLGLRRPRLERALLLLGAGLVVAIAVLPVPRLYPTVHAFHAVALGVAAYAVVQVLRHLGRLRRAEKIGYALAGTLGLGLAGHDLALQLAWIPAEGPYLIAYMIPLLLLAFGATLLVRFVASLQEAERMRGELEARVRAKHAELEANYRRLRALEQRELLAAERDRIMREMHDGVGNRLVSALALVEGGRSAREELAEALRASLDEMRLVIDSLDPDVSGLEELLGQLRGRLEAFARRHGLGFTWRAGALPAMPHLGPEEHLHVLRIVQEALTNVVKHAQATRVAIRTAVEDDAVVVEVRDDGVGLPPDPGSEGATAGRGLANLRHRAAALGGSVIFASGATGTCVALRIPRPPSDAGEAPA